MNCKSAAQSMNYGMNTVMTHKAFGRHSEESLQEVRSEAVRLEGMLSRFMHGNEISRINRSAGKKNEQLSSETLEVLSCAIEFSKYSKGLFDVTIGPLINIWKSSKDTLNAPKEARIRQILPLVDYTGLFLDPHGKTAGLQRIGQSIDLGGIGKGFAGDRFIEIFKKYGVSSAFTNIGGNVAVLGTKPDGSPWRIGIQHPRQENKLIGFITVKDKAVVTSGDYQRFFIGNNGKRYHHILDPTTGYPAESGLISVTIVAESSTTADALSTVLFAAGLEKGLEILKQFQGAEAVLVDVDLQVYITARLRKYFQTDENINVNIL